MFLKSLTLRGFKSFAEKTRLDFEPGITVIVGPNGSGKSNIVDALAWVLGTHSAKTLRGGSMADVIFAGGPGRSGLGRAAADITIDNTAGALPIDCAEVTVSRAMFATGENDYAINREPCRLLDVQELLSDTGLGRENHTIVGQGRLDVILGAKPEDRRVFIEEAAGILKHRRRKERALRKLAEVEEHLERLGDVLRELRRNLRPLERQAEAAARHAELSDALLAVRRTRATRELRGLLARVDEETAGADAADERLARLEASLAAARQEEERVAAALDDLVPRARSAAEVHFRLANLVERFRGLAGRVEERRNALAAADEGPVTGRDPRSLRQTAEAERATLAEASAERDQAEAAVAEAGDRRRQAEQARRAHEQAAAAEARRRREARERLLRWEGEVAGLRGLLAQAAGEEGRLASQVAGLAARRDELEGDVARLQEAVREIDRRAAELAQRRDRAERMVAEARRVTDEALGAERSLERRRASLEARAEALRAASQEPTGGGEALLSAAEAGDLDGLLGPLAQHVTVVEGMRDAVAAGLGLLGDALLAASPEAADDAIGTARSAASGRVVLLAGDPSASPPPREPHHPHVGDGARPLADDGARPLADALTADPSVLAALRRALAGVWVVDDWAVARRCAATRPDATFVTRAGEVAGARGWAGGGPTALSAVGARSGAEEAAAAAADVAAQLDGASARRAKAEVALADAAEELDEASAALRACDGDRAGAAERLERLHSELAGCTREHAAAAGQHDDVVADIADQRGRLDRLEERGPGADDPDDDRPDVEAERLDDALAAARDAEVEARLAAGAAAQRCAELERRISALEAEAEEVEAALAQRERRRRARQAAIERCAAVADVVAAGLRRAETSMGTAAADRDSLEAARSARDGELGAIRARLREIEAELEAARSDRHADDLRRAELRHRVDAVRARLAADLDRDPDTALAEDAPASGSDEHLAEEEERLSRALALLGTVNPLAMEEYDALQERHRHLQAQLDDVRASRRDLIEVVEAVDGRVRELFGAAFADVAREFERLFPLLFPGGEGRLLLTDPDDLLTTGVEVEARPPGKRVNRLSLLSGGERSLVAIAVLFAIFAARPSPFYVLDEVEAALDDVNLQRFLAVVGEFRATSQLLIVTHQKRTMEIADCLYGVSMQRDGLSRVVSQRLTEPVAVGS